ncbi:flavodoxin [Xylanimonas ulmi]|uniref:flavodoxin n=1 Tax=Xylanimonas ulmi TaxID=228973 RepID=UPI001F5EC9B9|nr:flavodoxin [Xylanibacterium ulmi]
MAVDRRTVLRAGLAIGGVLLAAACSPPGPDTATSTAPSSSGPASPGPTTSPRPAEPTSSRVLLAYFSRAGENYHHGDRTMLDVGNTKVVAATIERIVDGADLDVYEIEAANPYPEDYEQTVDRNVREQQDDARPAIANPLPDLAGYDAVLLGGPVWNVRAPMIMRTFVEGAGLNGTTVHPFVTHAGSGMGRVRDEYVEMCPASAVTDGLAVRGEEAREVEPSVTDWLRGLGLPAVRARRNQPLAGPRAERM